jgi:hypothetical protein
MQAEEDNADLRCLLDQLRGGSEFLLDHKEACTPMWNHFTGKIYSFYELEKTETVIQVGLPGTVLKFRADTDVNRTDQSQMISREGEKRSRKWRNSRLGCSFLKKRQFRLNQTIRTWRSLLMHKTTRSSV